MTFKPIQSLPKTFYIPNMKKLTSILDEFCSFCLSKDSSLRLQDTTDKTASIYNMQLPLLEYLVWQPRMHSRPEPQVFADPQQLPYLVPEQVWLTVAPHLPAVEVGSAVEVDEVLVEVLLVLVEVLVVLVVVLVLVVVEVVLGLVVLVVLVLVDVTVFVTVEVTPPARDQNMFQDTTCSRKAKSWGVATCA